MVGEITPSATRASPRNPPCCCCRSRLCCSCSSVIIPLESKKSPSRAFRFAPEFRFTIDLPCCTSLRVCLSFHGTNTRKARQIAGFCLLQRRRPMPVRAFLYDSDQEDKVVDLTADSIAAL